MKGVRAGEGRQGITSTKDDISTDGKQNEGRHVLFCDIDASQTHTIVDGFTTFKREHLHVRSARGYLVNCSSTYNR